MKHFADVIAAYSATTSLLHDLKHGGTGGSGDDRYERSLVVNDCAYFMLMFSQFEDEVNRLCEGLIRRKKALCEWEERRSWDILDDKQVRTLGFMRRVALLTEKGGRIYNRVKALYEVRNAIAHGSILFATVELGPVARDLQDIASQLQERS